MPRRAMGNRTGMNIPYMKLTYTWTMIDEYLK